LSVPALAGVGHESVLSGVFWRTRATRDGEAHYLPPTFAGSLLFEKTVYGKWSAERALRFVTIIIDAYADNRA
jgi:hypothetical protein